MGRDYADIWTWSRIVNPGFSSQKIQTQRLDSNDVPKIGNFHIFNDLSDVMFGGFRAGDNACVCLDLD